ncbi:MFS transporter [Rossellomorea vietnamensis]|uniref:MFS transporter n=1 Tax=Rossellomorea vietnamensis TaxID=218284 RepID=A0A5D4NJ53_9BACI|nr:MFS transporter [Rossellomorea vietnamensis]TYS13774.1 MFS transporter [Rossellomorea vietnamensis]
MKAYILECRTNYKSYNRNVKMAIAANLFTQIGLGIFMTLYNLYLRDLGYSELTNGNVIAMTALAQAIFLVPAGFLSDLWGRKRVMALGAVLAALTLLGRSFFEGETTLIILAFGSGAFMAFIQVSMIPWLAENSTEKERVHLFSMHFAIMMAANVIGNLFGGLLSDVLSLFGIDSLTSLRLTLILGSFLYLAGILPILKMKESVRKQPKKILEKSQWRGKGKQWKLVFLFVGAQLIIGIGSGLVVPYLNLYFAERFQTSHSAIGFILSLGQGATAIAMIIGPAVVNKIGEVKAVVLLQLSSLPFLILTGITTNLYLAVVGFLFRQALMNAGNPIQMALMMKKVPDDKKGIANSLSQMAFSIGWATMGPVSTYIVAAYGSYWGYSIVFAITGCIYFIGAVYFLLVFGEKSTSIKKQPAAAS